MQLWRTARAARVAFLVDAAAYFDVVTAAMERARRSIFVLAWETHSKTRMRAGETLTELLRRVTDARPDLDVRFLVWDPSQVFLFQREPLLRRRFRRRAGDRVQLALAEHHPAGASHHEKLVVIDDALAFMGGIDLAPQRWDRPSHLPDDPRRQTPSGEAYRPVHDVQMVVDGDAARALADLFRRRWHRATGEAAAAPSQGAALWPRDVTPHMRDVDIGIARTEPEYDGAPAVREVEHALSSAIASARRFIYIENQYITSPELADALAARLRQDDGPEIVIVTSREFMTPIERKTMGKLQAACVERLRAADRFGRLRVVGPMHRDVNIHVHTKLMIVDDRLLLLGSANLSRRSLMLDTECVAVIDADAREDVAGAIASLRARLLSEHCGAPVGESMRPLVDASSDPSRGRALVRVESEPVESEVIRALADPRGPIDEELLPRKIRKSPLLLSALAVAAVALVVAWRRRS